MPPSHTNPPPETERSRLTLLLDAGVPDSVGDVLTGFGHHVIRHRDVLPERTPDDVVCTTAMLHKAILVACDGDMRQLANRFGVAPSGSDRFKNLNLIRLCCSEVQAANRLRQARGLIEFEWRYSEELRARRLWIDVADHFLRTYR